MVKISVAQVFVILVFVDIATSLFPNETIADVGNHLKAVKTRRQEGGKRGKKGRSTSSSRSRGGTSKAGSDDTLGLSTDGISSSKDSTEKKKVNKYRPKSSAERKGWRKWHRKCTPCIEDQVKKWRDPSIKWICGAFQRARRSFKSLCMMHYRNCQDGTMFTKIGDHRCSNDSANHHGEHFFYEYKVALSEESGDDSKETSSETPTAESSSDSKR